jgi:intracellular septation protein A
MTDNNAENSSPMLADKPPSETTNSQPKPKKESFFANLLMNIVIPTLILTKLSDAEYLGPTWALIIALAFPLSYGLRDFIANKKINVFSALGIVSVLLTGGLSLLQLDPQYFAIKEAAIPGILGVVTLVSIRTRYPLVKVFIYNDKVLKIQKVDAALEHYQTKKHFEQTLSNASFMIAASFFLSSILNYVLAKVILVSHPGTAEFNAELGKMTALSYPVIALPMLIIMMGTLFYVFRSIRLLTHLTLEEVINDGSNE